METGSSTSEGKDIEKLKAEVVKLKKRKEKREPSGHHLNKVPSSKPVKSFEEEKSSEDFKRHGFENVGYQQSYLDERTLLRKNQFVDPIDIAQMELMKSSINQEKTEDSNNSSVHRSSSSEELSSIENTGSDQESHDIKKFQEAFRQMVNLQKRNEDLEKISSVLKLRNRKLDEETKEILKANHMWEERYSRTLKEHEVEMREQVIKYDLLLRQISEGKIAGEKTTEELKMEEELKKVKEENSSLRKEVSEGEKARAKVNHLINNVKLLQTMFDEERREKALLYEREKHLREQISAMEKGMEIMESRLHIALSRRQVLQDEVKRLAEFIANNGHTSGSEAEILTCDQKEQIELLNFQLTAYTEDFQSEKKEKQKILEENKKLKMELASATDQIKTLREQIRICSTNFERLREERLHLMRLVGHLAPEQLEWRRPKMDQNFVYRTYLLPKCDLPDYYSYGIGDVSAKSQSDLNNLYLGLAEEKEMLSRQMNELETLGVNSKTLLPRPHGPRTEKNSLKNSNVVPDADIQSITSSYLSDEKSGSIKFPSSCPKCGLSKKGTREFMNHYDNCKDD